MKTFSDQIKDLENTRGAKVAAMEAVAQKSMGEGRSMDEAEAEEFDTLADEIKALDSDLVRLRQLERFAGQSAKPANGTTVQPTKGQDEAAQRRGAPSIIVNKETDEKFKGQMFTRKVIAKALAHLDGVSAIKVATDRWAKTNPLLVECIKAEVAGGGSGSGEWGAELVSADARYMGDFVEYLYSKTVFDKLPLREVPAHVTIKGQDGQATGYWVGESKPIPASALDFSDVTLTPLKVAALAVVSNELLRDSSPSAEMLVRDALVQATAQRIDTTFISAVAASAGVSPAGILNGVTALTSSGPDVEGLYEDIKNLYAPFITAKNASGLYYVMNPSLAKAIQLMRSALGQKQFPDITTAGGMLEGDNVVTGDNVAANALVLLKPSDIYKIGDMGIQVSMSRDATVEQHTAPTGASDTPVAQSQYPVSMFQSESTAIKVVRPMNFAKRRSSAVAYINDASYSQGTSGA